MESIRTLADLRNALKAGTRVSVDNHFISRPDHPCFGRRDRYVVRATGGGLWLSHPEYENGSRVDWPKRSQLVPNGDGSVTFLGGGCGQADDEPFMTIRILPEERHEIVKLFEPAPTQLPGQLSIEGGVSHA